MLDNNFEQQGLQITKKSNKNVTSLSMCQNISWMIICILPSAGQRRSAWRPPSCCHPSAWRWHAGDPLHSPRPGRTCCRCAWRNKETFITHFNLIYCKDKMSWWQKKVNILKLQVNILKLQCWYCKSVNRKLSKVRFYHGRGKKNWLGLKREYSSATQQPFLFIN